MHDEEVVVPKVFGIDANRFVAFAGPHIAWISGAVATWIMTKVDLFATFGLDKNVLSTIIAQALVFGVITLVVWLGNQKWLDGFQKWAYSTATAIGDTELPASYHNTGGTAGEAPGAVPAASPPPFDEEGPVSG